MNLPKIILLPLGAVALVGACAPYPPAQSPPSQNNQEHPELKKQEEPARITDKKQRELDAERRRIKREREKREIRKRENKRETAAPKPKKPNYPTASAVPGKSGFVFNPYTHNIVNVTEIASGRLVRDPDDSDAGHKFRVP